MSIKPTKRRHHYLPQWYLKRFTKNGSVKSKLSCINLKDGKMFDTRPINVGVERDFNRIDHPNISADELEDRLALFEYDLQRVVKDLENAKAYDTLNADHKKWLLSFIALLAIRTPGMRKHHESQLEKMYKVGLDASVSVPVGTKCNGYIITQEIKDFVKADAFKIEISREQLIQDEFDFIDIVVPLLHERKWCMLQTTDEVPYVTSDSPSILCWNENLASPFSPGYGLKNTTVIMPLSKNLAAVGTYNYDNDIYLPANKELVAEINATIFCHSRQFVYSPTKKFWVKKKDGSLSDEVNSLLSMALDVEFRR